MHMIMWLLVGLRAYVRIIITSTVVLLPACDIGQLPAEQSGTVSGVVAAAKTAEGVANLVVVLVRDGQVRQSTSTSEDGAFRFEGLEPGQYTVALTGVEFSDVSPLKAILTPSEQTVMVGDDPIDLTFAVVGIVPARIVGEVLCGGRPAVGAEVRVVGGNVAVVVRTDAVGRFGATDLAPGHYAVMAVDVPCEVSREAKVVALNAGQSISIRFEGP